MSFLRYPEYKDSGVQWLGEVPGHWTVSPLKKVISRIESGTSVNAIDTPAGHEELGVLKTSCVYRGLFDAEENKAVVPEEYDRVACPVTAGTLIVSRMNTPELVGAAGVVHTSYKNLFLPDRLWQVHFAGAVPDFVHHWTHTPSYRAQVEMACAGTSSSMQNLGQDEFRCFVLALPPPNEQTAIATFLDHETAKIDALVAEQEKLIALLQEKRQAVISHAVTKGLNPNVPMKDSGVEWLGEVPAHWEVLPLKRISPQQTVGIVVNPSEYLSDEGLPFIYGGNVTEGRIDHISSRRISPEDSQRNEKTRLKAGDLITVRVGAPGITAVVPPECEGGNCASVMLVRQGEFNSDWLCFVMNSRVVRYQVEIVQYGAAQQQFNINHAVEFVIPQPPRAEQDALASFLTSETTRLGNLEAEARTAIALLQERRTALISAAVTGQIDVRGLASSANAPD